MSVRKSQRLLPALGMLTAITACSTQSERLIEQGATPAYAEGYADGCESGRLAGGDIFAEMKKAEGRYVNGGEYAEAWDEAFERCRANTVVKVREARRRNPHRNR